MKTVSCLINADPIRALWATAIGCMPGFVDDEKGPPAWIRYTHRGVQYLSKLAIPSKHRSRVFNPKWEIRYNTSFEEVVRGCGDNARATIQKRGGNTWITDELIAGSIKLHKMGYAYSIEAWTDGALAGGLWGYQLGGFINIESAFHRVSNASKACFGQGQIYMKERGFEMVDWCTVPDHEVNFGVEWIPQWKYEVEVARLINQPVALLPNQPPPALPWQIKLGLPAYRKLKGIKRRVTGMIKKPVAPAQPPVAAAPEPAPTAPSPNPEARENAA